VASFVAFEMYGLNMNKKIILKQAPRNLKLCVFHWIPNEKVQQCMYMDDTNELVCWSECVCASSLFMLVKLMTFYSWIYCISVTSIQTQI